MDALLHSTNFWVAISFVIFVAMATRPLIKGLNGWLDGKIGKIQSDISTAANLRAEAEALLNDAKARTASAEKDAAALLARAEADVAALKTRSEADLQAMLAQREVQAKNRIEQAEKQALSDLQQMTANVALEAARALLKAELSDDNRAKLVDQAIAGINKAA